MFAMQSESVSPLLVWAAVFLLLFVTDKEEQRLKLARESFFKLKCLKTITFRPHHMYVHMCQCVCAVINLFCKKAVGFISCCNKIWSQTKKDFNWLWAGRKKSANNKKKTCASIATTRKITNAINSNKTWNS